MRTKIYFRADASSTIGYGHFFRSLALADMLKESFDCTFFTQNPTDFQREQASKVCPLVSLPDDDTKFSAFLETLSGEEIVVLDNYFYTSEYQQAIKSKGCKLVCIDDVHDKHFYADVVISPCMRKHEPYSTEAYTSLCMGPKWAMLRKVFLEGNPEDIRREGRAVVTFGGADIEDNTTKESEKLLQKGYTDIVRIGGLKGRKGLSAEEMAQNFREASLVVCSASTVCLEALACGAKVEPHLTVDNQKDFYELLTEDGFTMPDVTKIAERYRRLFRSISFDVIPYTELTEQQSHEVWKHRNMDCIRCCMTNPKPFSFESHKNFIEKLKSDKSKLFWAVFDGDDFVASFDMIDIQDENADRGLYVAPKWQGQGIASTFEEFFEGKVYKLGVRTLHAEVLTSNETSYKYHLSVGYRKYQEKDGMFYLTKDL